MGRRRWKTDANANRNTCTRMCAATCEMYNNQMHGMVFLLAHNSVPSEDNKEDDEDYLWHLIEGCVYCVPQVSLNVYDSWTLLKREITVICFPKCNKYFVILCCTY